MVNSLYSNPFVLGKNIPEELFCDRDEETRTLVKQVLIAIASEGFATNVTSGAFIKKHSLPSASSLQTALKALIDKSIVMRTEHGYRLEDFFFAEWLRKR